MDKCIIFFLEGETEKEFYREMVSRLRKNNSNTTNIKVEFKNLSGVGGFKKIAVRKFQKDIKSKYDKNKYFFVVVLCCDTDVFDMCCIPPVNMENVKKELLILISD